MAAQTGYAAIPLVIQRMDQAMNHHDLRLLADCLDPNYRSERPCRRGVWVGRDKAVKSWSTIFHRIPNFQAHLIRCADNGESIWTEWHWSGDQINGVRFEVQGVIIVGVEHDCITWGRLYMEPVKLSREELPTLAGASRR